MTEISRFDGFEPANTTPVPDILFDELLTELSGAELKVMLYIIRRTLGFKKTTDAISLTQFEKGIITQERKVLDRGCGLKDRETICNALQSLESKGCIKSQKRNATKRDKDTTIYSIRFKGEPATLVGKTDYVPSRKNRLPNVVGKTDYGSRKNPNKVVGKSDLQETVIQETVKQETVYISADADSACNTSSENLYTLSDEGSTATDFAGDHITDASKEISTKSVDKPAKQKKPIIPPGPLVMPSDDAKWCAETAVTIVEVKKGKRYSEVTRRQELAKAALALRYEIDGNLITRAQFEQAWEEIAAWSLWTEKNLEPMIRHLLKDDRIVTLLQRPVKVVGKPKLAVVASNGINYSAAAMDTSRNYIKSSEEELAQLEAQYAAIKARKKEAAR
jgi:hypothetical protein